VGGDDVTCYDEAPEETSAVGRCEIQTDDPDKKCIEKCNGRQ